MSATLIDRARYVVTVDDSFTILENASVLFDETGILAIGPAEEVNAHRAAATAERLDGTGRLVLPGLVNLHTHLPMALLRGIAEDVDLDGFLTRVWAAEAAVMDRETVELGATLGALECLLGGTTTALDMYFFHEEAHRGAVTAGLRHVIGPVFFDGPGPDGLTWDERLDGLRAWPEALAEIGGPGIPTAALPHSTYTASPDHIAEVADILRALPGPHLLSTHVSETAAENEDVQQRHHRTPTQILSDAGWFAHGIPVVAAHGIHLSPDDRQTLAQAEAAVAHCPGSNLKLDSGLLPFEQWRADGIRLGLGTDGCSSSNDLDLWAVLRQAALLARHTAGRPDAGHARDIVRAATIEGAKALGLGDRIGSIEVGKEADLVLLELDQPHLTPVFDVAALLVFAAGRGDVRDVFVAGRHVVAHSRSRCVDVPAIVSVCRERARLV